MEHKRRQSRKKSFLILVVITGFNLIGGYLATRMLLTSDIGDELSKASTPQREWTPKLLPTDVIYSRDWWERPTVIEEFKLVFFTIPKVACTEWKTLFRRMQGLPPIPPTQPLSLLGDPQVNNMKTLYDYTLKDAENIMTSPEWTRAIFVREPKERILSAFLNKMLGDKFYFRDRCCKSGHENIHKRTILDKVCDSKIDEKDFGYFLNRTQDCIDDHWMPQVEAIDKKWWQMINFVGYMDTLSQDSERLLKSLVSDIDGSTAWDKYGKTGWGDGNDSFMQKNSAGHAKDAKANLQKYYTPDLERFVEEHWSMDWEQKHLNFKEYKIFQ